MRKTLVLLSLLFSFDVYGNQSHSHDEKEEHAHEKEHELGHEENSQVGAGKGIVSASEEHGIQISPQAEKVFEIQRVTIQQTQTIELPKTAVVTAGTEVNLYRYRDGHYKRIDFELIRKTEKQIVVLSKDLKKGDEIVVRGMGLLRIAEIAAFGGAPEGHSH